MSPRMAVGIAIHIMTASGAIAGLLALDFAARGDWQGAFGCLGLALAIDGVDGPLARRYEVETTLPRFSGVRLDLVVDYLNYCLVPAFILLRGDLMPEVPALLCAAIILLSSLFHFADLKSKTSDGYFVGFPALWNIIILYVFVFGLTYGSVVAMVLIFAALTFVPVKWTHPVRARRLRGMTLLVIASWSVAALYAVHAGFPGPWAVQAVFAAAALYFIGLALTRSVVGPGPDGRVRKRGGMDGP